MDKTIEVIIKEPGKAPYKKEISNKLYDLQKEVGGFIETVTIGSNLVIICNEEGRLIGLPYNCTLLGIDFVGTIIIAGMKRDEFTSVPSNINKLGLF